MTTYVIADEKQQKKKAKIKIARKKLLGDNFSKKLFLVFEMVGGCRSTMNDVSVNGKVAFPKVFELGIC